MGCSIQPCQNVESVRMLRAAELRDTAPINPRVSGSFVRITLRFAVLCFDLFLLSCDRSIVHRSLSLTLSHSPPLSPHGIFFETADNQQ